MEFAEELRGSLQEFLVGATIEIRENGSRSTAISPLSREVRGEGGKPLLHLGRKMQRDAPRAGHRRPV
jgi:hypothetical protein